MSTKKDCNICGKVFIPSHSRSKTCSSCIERYPKVGVRKCLSCRRSTTGSIYVPCILCGTPFVKIGQSGHCGDCRKKYTSQERKTLRRKGNPVTLSECRCVVCDSVIELKVHNQKYCDDCKSKHCSRTLQKLVDGGLSYKSYEFICVACDTPFVANRKDQKFCPECQRNYSRNKLIAARKVGRDHPFRTCDHCQELYDQEKEAKPRGRKISRYCHNCLTNSSRWKFHQHGKIRKFNLEYPSVQFLDDEIKRLKRQKAKLTKLRTNPDNRKASRRYSQKREASAAVIDEMVDMSLLTTLVGDDH